MPKPEQIISNKNLIDIISNKSKEKAVIAGKGKSVKEITALSNGYNVNIIKEGREYEIYISDKDMTDIDLTKQIIRNKVNMLKKHEENLNKLLEMDI